MDSLNSYKSIDKISKKDEFYYEEKKEADSFNSFNKNFQTKENLTAIKEMIKRGMLKCPSGSCNCKICFQ